MAKWCSMSGNWPQCTGEAVSEKATGNERRTADAALRKVFFKQHVSQAKDLAGLEQHRASLAAGRVRHES